MENNMDNSTSEISMIESKSKKKSKKIILIAIALILVLIFIAYIMLLGNGRLLGTWQWNANGNVYEFVFKPFGFGESNICDRNGTWINREMRWEYDNKTKCLTVTIENGNVLTYEVLDVDGEKLILSSGQTLNLEVEYIKK